MKEQPQLTMHRSMEKPSQSEKLALRHVHRRAMSESLIRPLLLPLLAWSLLLLLTSLTHAASLPYAPSRQRFTRASNAHFGLSQNRVYSFLPSPPQHPQWHSSQPSTQRSPSPPPQAPPPPPSSLPLPGAGPWSSLQQELEAELSGGLDEAALHALEASAVSGRGTTCLLAQPRECMATHSQGQGAAQIVMDIRMEHHGANEGGWGMGTVEPSVHRLTIQLFNHSLPKTVANFVEICEGRNSVGLTYTNSPFHRIIKKFMAQGGDITRGDGRGGRSIYGRHFRDEGFQCRHVCRGVVSMANSGPDTNGSQFFITFDQTPWLDGKHVVFGQVIDGWSALDEMESFGSDTGRPNARITVQQCTVLR